MNSGLVAFVCEYLDEPLLFFSIKCVALYDSPNFPLGASESVSVVRQLEAGQSFERRGSVVCSVLLPRTHYFLMF